MCSTLRSCDCVNFIEYDCTRSTEHSPPSYTREHDVQRFRSSDQNVRRLSKHFRARGCRRITGAHRDSNLRKCLTVFLEAFSKLSERRGKIPMDIVVQRLEWRDVEQMN